MGINFFMCVRLILAVLLLAENVQGSDREVFKASVKPHKVSFIAYNHKDLRVGFVIPAGVVVDWHFNASGYVINGPIIIQAGGILNICGSGHIKSKGKIIVAGKLVVGNDERVGLHNCYSLFVEDGGEFIVCNVAAQGVLNEGSIAVEDGGVMKIQNLDFWYGVINSEDGCLTVEDGGALVVDNGKGVGIRNEGSIVVEGGGVLTLCNDTGTGVYNHKSSGSITVQDRGVVVVSHLEGYGIHNDGNLVVEDGGTMIVRNLSEDGIVADDNGCVAVEGMGAWMQEYDVCPCQKAAEQSAV